MRARETFVQLRSRLTGVTAAAELTYGVLPERLRNQIVHAMDAAIGPYQMSDLALLGIPEAVPPSNETWRQLQELMLRELGLLSIGRGGDDPRVSCREFVLGAEDVPQLLYTVQTALSLVEARNRDLESRRTPGILYRAGDLPDCSMCQPTDEVIAVLNRHFLENGVGYQYENGQIIRVDSELLHSTVVRPAIHLLRDSGFAVANSEYLQAHEHYLAGNYADTLTWALKAFESTMKTICDKRGWPYATRDAAAKLLEVCFDNALIPARLQSHFCALRATLEAGLPSVRNQPGAAHGAGSQPVTIPRHIAGYALHLAGANIVLLVEADRTLG